jgi:hypothetical protein
MKTLIIGLLVAGGMALASGCAAPAYSGGVPSIKFPREQATGENANNVLRAWHHESRQLVDDINMVMLWDRPSQMSRWHVR